MFFEDNEVTEVRAIDLEEKRVYVPSPTIQQNFIPMPNMHETPTGDPEPEVDPQPDEEPQHNEDPQPDEDPQPNDEPQPNVNPQPSRARENAHTNEPTRRSQREKKKAISSDYVTFMCEDENDIGKAQDPTSYKEATKSEDSSKWLVAMEDELKSMSSNDVWDL